MWPEMVEIERQIDAIMNRVDKVGDDHAERVAALEEYIPLRASCLSALSRESDDLQVRVKEHA